MTNAQRSFSAVFCGILFVCCQTSDAQILKRIKDEVKNRTERKLVNKAGDATDKTIDKVLDGPKDGAADKSDNGDVADAASANTSSKVKPASVSNYKNYDFVAGDKIIFEPDLSTEPDAELPARFTIRRGNAEIQSFNGEKILHLQADGDATVEPLMKSESYLPEQFTLEFDMMFENDDEYFRYVSDFDVEFRKKEDNDYSSQPLYRFVIESNSRAAFGSHSTTAQTFPENLKKSVNTGNIWHHIAIYVRKNIGKAYIDAYRVCATNTLPVGAGKVDIKADRYGVKIKNFRLAAGGEDKYQKIVTDGKFVTHGILFDVNKSSIKPESMGTLNDIAKLMKEHADLKFEIDGHTDSDGNNDANMKLSQARAEAVKAKLVELGIDDARLSTKGFGESKPIDSNNSAEGKANNRRVEFVKI